MRNEGNETLVASAVPKSASFFDLIRSLAIGGGSVLSAPIRRMDFLLLARADGGAGEFPSRFAFQ